MLDAGIVAQGEDGTYYDALGNRIIVPIINQNNDVIGFGGRIIKGESNAKYKNTAQTLAFDKRKNLFGINILKKEKRENNFDYAILVEGYMDVISLYQAGITNSVASMGTSLTIEQCELFKKTRINKVVVSFDGDTAGQAATMRSLDLLSNKGIEVKVISLLAGLDPDDTVKRYGKNGFLSLVDNALPLIDFKLKKIEDYYDLSILNNRSKYANTCIELLATLEDELAANVYLDLVSKKSGTTIEILREALIKRKTTPKPFFNNSIQFQDTILKNEKSREVKKGLSSAEDIVASAIINKKAFACIDDIKDLTFVNDVNTVVVNYVKEQLRENKRFIIGDLFSLELDKEEIGRLSEVINCIDEKMVQKVYNDALLKLKKNSIDTTIKSLNIKYITSDNEDEKKEIINKIKELKQLQFIKKE